MTPGSHARSTSARRPIRLTVSGTLEHRDLVLRTVGAACKLVTAHTRSQAWYEFQNQVVSAVSEAFNNLVLHAYGGKEGGRVEIVIRSTPDRIEIEIRDWGRGFDPKSVPIPALDSLPESGLGLFIIQSFMEARYRRGRPNLLTLRKTLRSSDAPQPSANEGGGDRRA